MTAIRALSVPRSAATRLLTDPRFAALLLVVGLGATAVLLATWWPAGVLVGVVAGALSVLQIGVIMQRADAAQRASAVVAAQRAHESAVLRPASAGPAEEDGVRRDLEHLKAGLGDVWPDFARAARLVVSTQYASAARLQRELQVPYSRARRILDDLESEHFVGPATGSLPRRVLLSKERLPEVERLFATV